MRPYRFACILLTVLIGLLAMPAHAPVAAEQPTRSAPPSAAASSTHPFLIDDYASEPVPASEVNTALADFTPLSDTRLVFTALQPASGRELWVTDGTASTTQLLADLLPGVASSDPRFFHAIDGEAWFWAFDAVGGPRQLWRTDGTAAGTHVFELAYDYVDTIVAGDDLVKLNARLLFVGVDAAGGAELWRSNGASSDTVRVKDINPGPAGSNPQQFIVVNGWLYFTAFDGTSWGLWRTDHSTANTTLVQADVQVEEVSAADSTLYFRATRADGSCGLWRSDGTPAGTQIIAAECGSGLTPINGQLAYISPNQRVIRLYDPGSASTVTAYEAVDAFPYEKVVELNAINGKLAVLLMTTQTYMAVLEPQANAQPTILINSVISLTPTADHLYISSYFRPGQVPDEYYLHSYDGTRLERLIERNDSAGAVSGFTLWGQGTVFNAYDSLWRTDNTAAGTQQITDISSAAPGSLSAYNDPDSSVITTTAGIQYMQLNANASQTLLTIDPAQHAVQALRTEDTLEPVVFGPHTLIFPSPPLVITAGQTETETLPISAGTALSVEYNGALYIFVDIDGAHTRLWRTDGTSSGTTFIKEFALSLQVGAGQRTNDYATLYKHTLVLWPSQANTSYQLSLINMDTFTMSTRPYMVSSPPANLAQTLATENWLYVYSYAKPPSAEFTPLTPGALWATDGTLTNTVVLTSTSINSPLAFTMLGSTADQSAYYFNARSFPLHIFYLTDPTSTTLHYLGQFASGLWLPFTYNLANGTIIFEGYNDYSNGGLSLGGVTPSGMQILLTTTRIDLQQPVALDQIMLVPFHSPDTGRELWATDGTLTGTVQLTDINPGPADADVHFVAQTNGRQLFTGTGPSGLELWSTDGTPGGTLPLSTSPLSSVTALVTSTSQLLFSATDTSGSTLWRTDGTPAGTHQLAALTAQPTVLAASADHVFLALATAATGRELWATSADFSQLILLGDSQPGTASSDPQALAALDAQTMLYSADDGVHGRELWRTDGTPAGTRMVKDSIPGPAGLKPQAATATLIDGRLVFAASDEQHGTEPWVSDGTELGTFRLGDIAPGSASGVSEPAPRFHATTVAGRQPRFQPVGDYLVFYANDLVHGDELWAITLNTLSFDTPAQSYAPPAGLARLPFALQTSGITVPRGPMTVTLTLDPALTYVDTTASVTPTVDSTTLTWVFATPPVEQPWQVRVRLPSAPLGTHYALLWTVQSTTETRSQAATLTSAAQVFLPSVRR